MKHYTSRSKYRYKFTNAHRNQRQKCEISLRITLLATVKDNVNQYLIFKITTDA